MIDPEKIRRRLDEVWGSLGRQADAEGHEVMRACALTLIAVVDAEDHSETIAETLAELMREHPSRAIVVRLAKGQGDALEADVEARCWMPFGQRRQICSEQIVIDCTEKTLADVPGVILPLAIADLPVVLWCASERAWRSGAFPELAEPAGRVILDTMRVGHPLELLEAMKSRRGRAPGLGLIADLSWTRLTRWRSLLAQVFENELYRKQIPNFSEVVIEYEGIEGAPVPPTGLLLSGWLLSILGWRWEGGLPAGLRFCRRPADCRPARLAAFELLSHHEPVTRIAIARSGESCGEVRVEVAGLEPVRNRVSLPRSTDRLLLGEELAIYKPDPTFEQSLEWAVRVGRALTES